MSPSRARINIMSKLVLVDGNAIIHRAYHAMPLSLTDKDGNPTNAVYGFTSMLLRIIEDLEPSHLVVCFDRKEPTFRKEMFDDYQAHRPEADESLVSQFDTVRKVVDSFGKIILITASAGAVNSSTTSPKMFLITPIFCPCFT